MLLQGIFDMIEVNNITEINNMIIGYIKLRFDGHKVLSEFYIDSIKHGDYSIVNKLIVYLQGDIAYYKLVPLVGDTAIRSMEKLLSAMTGIM